MPSLFPGMDPYLEGNLWTSFHALFATQIVRDLNGRLGPEYVALAQQLRPETGMPASVPHTWVNILDVATRKVVAVIEFLSRDNKRGLERKEYLRKRERILLSSAHLLEIDLLRKGARVPMRDRLPAADYFIFLSRMGNRPLTEVWPIPLDQPLPTVPVPLLSKDPDVLLDLQAVFAAVYDEGRYRALVDYSLAPDVPVSKETTAWLKKRLKGK
jgi:hypothetical protein